MGRTQQLMEKSEISSLVILLEDITRRITVMADKAEAEEDGAATDLIGIERSLQASLRRLRRLS